MQIFPLILPGSTKSPCGCGDQDAPFPTCNSDHAGAAISVRSYIDWHQECSSHRYFKSFVTFYMRTDDGVFEGYQTFSVGGAVWQPSGEASPVVICDSHFSSVHPCGYFVDGDSAPVGTLTEQQMSDIVAGMGISIEAIDVGGVPYYLQRVSLTQDALDIIIANTTQYLAIIANTQLINDDPAYGTCRNGIVGWLERAKYADEINIEYAADSVDYSETGAPDSPFSSMDIGDIEVDLTLPGSVWDTDLIPLYRPGTGYSQYCRYHIWYDKKNGTWTPGGIW